MNRWNVIVFALFAFQAAVWSQKTMVCYYSATTSVPATAVPADLCTHIIFAFGQITGDGIVPYRPSDVQRYRVLMGLKKKNPSLKVIISLQKGFDSAVLHGTKVMKTFSSNAVKFLQTHGFDGVDLDWEFPNILQKDSYATFIQVLGGDLKQANLSLSAALPNNPWWFKAGYDPSTLSKFMDFMTAMTYDFHVYSARDNRTGYNSPLFTPKGELKLLSTAALMEYYTAAGIPAKKLLVGIPSYGRSWKLANPSNHKLHALATGKGDPAPYTGLRGLYLYPDVCKAKEMGAVSYFDQVNGAAYLYTKSDWVAFDSNDTTSLKINFMKKSGYGGIGIWALHLDDASGVCKAGPFPLLTFMRKKLDEIV